MTGLRFVVLGSGTTVPTLDRGPAGFLVQLDGRSWLVDGGTGTLQRCLRAGVDPRTLDGGFYSHHHPDHCGDLVPLLFSMRVGPPPRDRDYPIVAGAGFGAFLDGLRGVYGKWIRPGRGEVALRELSLDGPDGLDLDGLQVDSRPANHAAAALHLRWSAGGRSVVFSGDTGPSEALAVLAAGADLLVCECGGDVEGHLGPAQVAAIVDAARPAAVWLTHLYPDVDPAEAVSTVARTGVPTRLAADGDAFPFPR
ncbi:MAG: MBL fold metallo-hydrolase [Myxococcota bacterium]